MRNVKWRLSSSSSHISWRAWHLPGQALCRSSTPQYHVKSLYSPSMHLMGSLKIGRRPKYDGLPCLGPEGYPSRSCRPCTEGFPIKQSSQRPGRDSVKPGWSVWNAVSGKPEYVQLPWMVYWGWRIGMHDDVCSVYTCGPHQWSLIVVESNIVPYTLH